MLEITSVLIDPARILEGWNKTGFQQVEVLTYPDRWVLRVPDKELAVSLLQGLPPVLVREGNIPWLANLLERLSQRKEMVVTAESCTGGMIGSLLTDIPGSSRVYWGGFVTYSNDAKKKLLHVPGSLLESKGAVSGETVFAMARNALEQARSHWSIAVSGIAGPGGGTPEKPVGLVYIGLLGADGYHRVEKIRFSGNREQIRRNTTRTALLLLERAVYGEINIDMDEWKAYI